MPAFQIDGLNRLTTLIIGKNSFTQLRKYNWDWRKADNTSKSFHILNCESLESIEIGEYSFSDYAGDFELKNLPQLQSIQIGTIGSNSNNFYANSFVIRGIDMILNIWIMHRSSKSTIHYIRWLCIPKILLNSNGKYWINMKEKYNLDLLSLQSIQLGWSALQGKYNNETCSLTMRSKNGIIRIIEYRSSKSKINNQF